MRAFFSFKKILDKFPWSAIIPGNSSEVAAAVTDETGSPGSLVFSGNPTLAGITNSGNLDFTGTGNAIKGNFSSATLTERVYFQSSTTNGNTILSVLPNGTATISQIQCHNSSDIDNAGFFQLSAQSSIIQLLANKRGTGAYLPFAFFTNGAEQLRIAIDGSATLGGNNTTPAFKVIPVASQARWVEITAAASGNNPKIGTNAGHLETTGALQVATGFGCNSKTPQTAVAVSAASTDLASVVALCNQLRAALIANGICS